MEKRLEAAGGRGVGDAASHETCAHDAHRLDRHPRLSSCARPRSLLKSARGLRQRGIIPQRGRYNEPMPTAPIITIYGKDG
jgi:hypothetical protein